METKITRMTLLLGSLGRCRRENKDGNRALFRPGDICLTLNLAIRVTQALLVSTLVSICSLLVFMRKRLAPKLS
jgi:hypothetical protein